MHRFAKAIYEDGSRDMTLDGSLSGVFLFQVFGVSDEVVEGTMNAVAEKLWVKTDIGGIAHYENDEYFMVLRMLLETPGLYVPCGSLGGILPGLPASISSKMDWIYFYGLQTMLNLLE